MNKCCAKYLALRIDVIETHTHTQQTLKFLLKMGNSCSRGKTWAFEETIFENVLTITILRV